MDPTTPQGAEPATEPTTAPLTTQAPPAALPNDPGIFKAALPRGSHARNFAAFAVVTYIKSEGLSGLDPTFFSSLHDINPTLSAKVIPLIVQDLAKAGITHEKPVVAFGEYAGYALTPAFLAAITIKPDLLHPLFPQDAEHLKRLSEHLLDTSSAAIESRWIDAIGRAFECVEPKAPLAVPHLSRFLPDFDGKATRIERVLSALHDQELVTVARGDANSELHLHPTFFERITNCELATRLADPFRKKKEFPWAKLPVDIAQIRSVQAPPVPPQPIAPKGISLPKFSIPVRNELKGHAASQELRRRILDAMPEGKQIAPKEIVRFLGDSDLDGKSLRYHVQMLIDAGEITRSGKGRGVKIMRPRKTKG